MRVLAATFAYNEGDKIKRTLARHPHRARTICSCSTMDPPIRALEGIDPAVIVLRNETNRGIGSAMKDVFQYAIDKQYDVLVIQAGNDKDDPLEIPSCSSRSRTAARISSRAPYLSGGGFGNMPAYRMFATRIVHPLVFSLAARSA